MLKTWQSQGPSISLSRPCRNDSEAFTDSGLFVCNGESFRAVISSEQLLVWTMEQWYL